jgi:hypothetical protein
LTRLETAMPQTAYNEIQSKALLWKNIFKAEVEKITGHKIAEEPADLSYVQILNKTVGYDFSLSNIAKIISKSIVEIGSFSQQARQVISTPGYDEAKNIGAYIIQNYDQENFKEQMNDGPLIAAPPHLPDTRLAAVFHYPSYPVIELFFESKDEKEIALPDIFVLDNNMGLYTVKAVKNLEDNPVLKKRIQFLSQRPD